MVIAETAIVGAFGAVASAVLGAYTARTWVVNQLARLLGWHLTPSVPWSAIAVTLAAGTVVGVAAGLWGAYRTSGLRVVEALARN
jgi:ABC-type antimicrobial peptide transport system permease subunit